MLTLEEVDFRLYEWARWARQRDWGSARCRSIESRYRAPAGEVMNDEPRALPVAALDAWEVECTWRELPFTERMLLRAHYVIPPIGSAAAWDAHRRNTCRALSIHVGTWYAGVKRAVCMMRNRL